MRPSRRVAILFVTTFLSTRLLHASSESTVRMPRTAAEISTSEAPAKGPSGVEQSRSSRFRTAAHHDDCGDKAELLGPGGKDSKASVTFPLTFRWQPVAGAVSYTVIYRKDKIGRAHV